MRWQQPFSAISYKLLAWDSVQARPGIWQVVPGATQDPSGVLTALTVPPSSPLPSFLDTAQAVRELDTGNAEMSNLLPTTNPSATISFWDVRSEKRISE